MRFGFRTAGFATMPVAQILEGLAQAGYASVELCLEHPELDPRALRPSDVCRALQQAGLATASLSHHGDLLASPETVDIVVQACRLAPELGTRIVVISSARRDAVPVGADSCPPLRSAPRTMESLSRALAPILDAAEAAEVVVALEPEPDLVVETAADMLALARAMQSPRLVVNLDIGHAHLTDGVRPAIEALGARIVHAHLDDMVRPTHRHLLPGEGEINFPSTLAALSAIASDMPLVVDLFHLGPDPLLTARRARECLSRALC